ncbi:MAG: AbrB/MazE/SpoVT family DNA-binding domain-containing protein [Crinalium sp.]
MEVTKLSQQGQIPIPESIRQSHQWQINQEFIILEVGDGILLKPKKTFPETTLDQVAGCLKYQGKPKTIQEMNDAIRQGVEEL